MFLEALQTIDDASTRSNPVSLPIQTQSDTPTSSLAQNRPLFKKEMPQKDQSQPSQNSINTNSLPTAEETTTVPVDALKHDSHEQQRTRKELLPEKLIASKSTESANPAILTNPESSETSQAHQIASYIVKYTLSEINKLAKNVPESDSEKAREYCNEMYYDLLDLGNEVTGEAVLGWLSNSLKNFVWEIERGKNEIFNTKYCYPAIEIIKTSLAVMGDRQIEQPIIVAESVPSIHRDNNLLAPQFITPSIIVASDVSANVFMAPSASAHHSVSPRVGAGHPKVKEAANALMADPVVIGSANLELIKQAIAVIENTSIKGYQDLDKAKNALSATIGELQDLQDYWAIAKLQDFYVVLQEISFDGPVQLQSER